MERFSFSSAVAFVPHGDMLDRVTVAPLTPSIFEGSVIQAAIFRVAPGRSAPSASRDLPASARGSRGFGRSERSGRSRRADRGRRGGLLAQGRRARDEDLGRGFDSTDHRK